MSEEFQKELTLIILTLSQALDENATIKITQEGEQWRVNIQTKKEEIFRDFKDKTLNSIQHIARVLVHQKFKKDKTHFIVDVNMSKSNREKTLTNKIPILVQEEVIKTGRPVAIIGLNGYERLLIHNALSDIQGLETLSFGEKLNRRLVIRPTGESLNHAGFENARFVTVEEIEKASQETS